MFEHGVRALSRDLESADDVCAPAHPAAACQGRAYQLRGGAPSAYRQRYQAHHLIQAGRVADQVEHVIFDAAARREERRMPRLVQPGRVMDRGSGRPADLAAAGYGQMDQPGWSIDQPMKFCRRLMAQHRAMPSPQNCRPQNRRPRRLAAECGVHPVWRRCQRPLCRLTTIAFSVSPVASA
jgi:hypothetical protein